MNQTKKLFTKDFTLVVIGQIISLFGNAAIRFALPLYLLNVTGSPALYGTVTACAIIPSILLTPIGGIIADRVNKRNIMVALDFFTTLIVLTFSALMGSLNLIALLITVLMLLYGIAGAYQPSVQASIPVLVSKEHFMAANSVINTISSFSSLAGPVLGGILYSTYGLYPVLYVCAACFFISALMEIFIKIPYEKQPREASLPRILKKDFSESFAFIKKEKPFIGKTLLTICGINLFLSSMILVGLPYLITEVLDFPYALSNRLYGYASGALAAGGLFGGISAGVFSKKLSLRNSGNLLITCTLFIFPMGASIFFIASPMVNYGIITLCCFLIMIFSTLFTVQMLTLVQTETPSHLIGKVIALIFTLSTCAQPLGNALYGILFDLFPGREYLVILFSGITSLTIAVRAQTLFKSLVPAHLSPVRNSMPSKSE